MRYPFRTVAGTPALQPVNIGITLRAEPVPVAAANVAVTAPVVPSTPVVNLSVVAASPICTATIGGAAVSILLTLTNNGSTAAGGAVVTAPWLVDTADCTFGTLTATPSAGVTLGAFAKTNLVSGATVAVWPPGATITLAVSVTAVAVFIKSFVTQVVPAVGVADLSPSTNTNVITANGIVATAVVAWKDFVTPANTAASITAGVAERGGGTIGFCGDGYTEVRDGFGTWSAAVACPPVANANAARWRIALLGYNAANTYSVVANYSALSPPPATYMPTFAVTQAANLLTIESSYTLLGATIGDGIASAGNVLFEVFENAVSIGTVTLVLVMY